MREKDPIFALGNTMNQVMCHLGGAKFQDLYVFPGKPPVIFSFIGLFDGSVGIFSFLCWHIGRAAAHKQHTATYIFNAFGMYKAQAASSSSSSSSDSK